MRPLTFALCLSALAPLLAALPAQAQATADEEKVNLVIVYGEDKCPESTPDMITVCARKNEGERYRIPEPLRESVSPQNESWTNRVQAYETVNASGTMSCSPAGAGGWTGCSGKLIDQAYAEKRGESDVTFAKIIEEERGKRLATLDGDAAATQSRVEQAEKDNEARRRAEQDGTPLPPLTNPTPSGK